MDNSLLSTDPLQAVTDSHTPSGILAKGLCRHYSMGKGEVMALQSVDLEIAEGRFVVLKGRSGSGKTTLLSILAGLDRPDAGSLTVAGHRLDAGMDPDLTCYRREVVGMIFQSFHLMPTLTVAENIMLPGLLAGSSRRALKEKCDGFLSALEMEDRMGHFPGQLSGGEQQRVAIARSLINDPPVILADEPTGNLDEKTAASVMTLLARLQATGNRILIMATHSDVADGICDDVILMSDGRISGAGS